MRWPTRVARPYFSVFRCTDARGEQPANMRRISCNAIPAPLATPTPSIGDCIRALEAVNLPSYTIKVVSHDTYEDGCSFDIDFGRDVFDPAIVEVLVQTLLGTIPAGHYVKRRFYNRYRRAGSYVDKSKFAR